METTTEQSFATDDARWRAVEIRDPAADGQFFYAVRTTGIFCRPICPSRRPNRENAAFYESSAEARREGFVPCKRCRPTEVSSRQRVVAQVQEILECEESEPTLAELGTRVGLSPSHLQRVFKRATGLSPKQYAMARREERLAAALREGQQVTHAMYDAGYGSSQAMYSGSAERLGMAPRSLARGGEGERIAWGVFETTQGDMLVAATRRGLVAVGFGDAEALEAGVRGDFPRATLEHDPAAVESLRRDLCRFLEHRARSLDLPLDVHPSEFQRVVWEALRRIPFGETRSYGEVAEMIGRPGAARAVARACATNPVALAIPCHRVVRGSGELGGYRWGEGRKAALLEGERR